MKRFLLSTGLALAAVAAASPASAVVSVSVGAVSSTVPANPTSLYQSYTVYDFDSTTPAITGGQIVTGNSTPPGSNYYQAPAGDSTKYYAVGPYTPPGGTSTATLTGVNGNNQFSFYWGSIDSFNSVSFLGAGGSVIQTFSGNAIDAGSNGQNSREVTFTLSASDAAALQSIQFQSINQPSGTPQAAFEFDNLIVGTAVPEPATYGIMSLGLGMIGAVLRRRRKTGQAGSYSAA